MDADRLKKQKEISFNIYRFIRNKDRKIIINQVPKRKKRVTFVFNNVKKAVQASTKTKACKILGIVAAVFFGLSAITGLLMTGLLIFQNQLFYPATSYTTTTKISNAVTLNVGQLCQWNNQCPRNAYCLGTCQCSDNYFFDSTSGLCVAGIKEFLSKLNIN
jgi:hypothetical protein